MRTELYDDQRGAVGSALTAAVLASMNGIQFKDDQCGAAGSAMTASVLAPLSGWAWLRIRTGALIESVLYETGLFTLLLLNCWLVIKESKDVETRTSNSGIQHDEACFGDVTLGAINMVLLSLLVIERLMTVYVYRPVF